LGDHRRICRRGLLGCRRLYHADRSAGSARQRLSGSGDPGRDVSGCPNRHRCLRADTLGPSCQTRFDTIDLGAALRHPCPLSGVKQTSSQGFCPYMAPTGGALRAPRMDVTSSRASWRLEYSCQAINKLLTTTNGTKKLRISQVTPLAEPIRCSRMPPCMLETVS